MRAQIVIPVIASILILGTLGLSQDARAGAIPATLTVGDQFGGVHLVDSTMLPISSDPGCLDGSAPHHHAASGGVVTSTLGIELSDPEPFACGYGIVGDILIGHIGTPLPEIVIIELPDGGDCDIFGIWNGKKNTCKLIEDLVDNPIEIGDDGIKLDCDGRSITGSGAGSGTGILLDGKQDVTIQDCRVSLWDVGIKITGSNGNTIRVSILNDNGIGIRLGFSDDNELSGNVIESNDEDGIKLNDSHFTTIKNNDIFGNEGDGIELNDSDDSTINGNVITLNLGDGIFIHFDSDGNFLSSNDVSGNEGDGIELNDSSFSTLKGNVITLNLGDGILIHLDSDGNFLSGNKIFGNFDDGIELFDADDSILKGNTANDNGDFGFVEDATSTNNTFKSNKCKNNGNGGSDPTGLCKPQS